ncbi:hypothetical protein AAE478_002770 [Parahypoxylon ruwenzoriense]
MDAVDVTNPQQHYQQPQSQSKSQQPKHIKTGTWFPAEDARLREAVAKHGTRWVAVAGEVGTRNGDQCAKRWNENLNPELDHGPWTPEEEKLLLNLVEIYGHNWKFLANSFLEARAPLALKNRYSLLMRRLKRQGTWQQQAGNAGSTKPPRHTTHSRAASESTSPSPTSANAIDLTNFFASGGGSHGNHPDYAVMNAAARNFSISTGQFSTGMVSPSNSSAPNSRRGSAVPRTTTVTPPTTAWEDQDLVWQQYPYFGGGMELDNVSSGTGRNGVNDEMDKTAIISDHSTSSRRSHHSGGGSRLHSAAPSDSGDSGVAGAGEVEYSVTCQRGKLKTLVNHLVDAAMSESAGWTTEDDQVTITLRLKA